MSSLVKAQSQFRLTRERLEDALAMIQKKLYGRVIEAYVFGSASTGHFTEDSDIDLILIKNNPELPFLHRALEFSDLFEIYPSLDILVYSPDEFQLQLNDSAIGFWKSVRESKKRIV